MNRCLVGVAVALLTLAANAFADDTANHSIKFDFKSSDSISHWLGIDGSAANVPQLYQAPAEAHGNESGYLLLDSRKEETWFVRDQLFDGLGLAQIMPQGSFKAAGIQTNWHFSCPDQDTLLLKFSARF